MKPASRFENFPPYTPIEPYEILSERLGLPIGQIIKLDANENPYGPSQRALTALANLEFTHIYPDPESRALRASLAEFTGVSVNNLFCGAGADELIDLLIRVLIEPGETIITCPPTFSMYAFDGLLNAATVIEIPRRPDFSLDMESIFQAVKTYSPKILFLTTPNNPDGGLLSQEEISSLVELPILVVLDEAYIEFTTRGGALGEKQSMIREVPKRDNLVVLRTFSKWAGLAGLRVGYGAFPDWLLPTLWKAKQPYNINVAASTAAIASLGDLGFLAENVARIRNERDRLYHLLDAIPYLNPFPSQANFILCKVTGRPARQLKESLSQSGILVRYYNTPLLQDFIRITVGRSQDTDCCIKALKDLI